MPAHAKPPDHPLLAEAAPVYSLRDTLSFRSVRDLKKLASGFLIPGASKLRKAEVIDAVQEALQVPERLEQLLSVLEKPAWSFFQALAKEKQLAYPIPQPKERNASLEALGYIQLFHWEDGYIYVVPDEVKETFRTLVDAGFLAQKERADLIHDYATAAVHLYGVLLKSDFLQLFHSQTRSDADNRFIDLILARHMAMGDGYCLWKDYLLDDRFMENGFSDVADLLGQVGTKPRYLPDSKEFLHYADWAYFEPNIYTQRLSQFLTKNCGREPGSVWKLVSEIVNAKMMDGRVNTIFAILSCHGINIEDNQIEPFIGILTDVSDHTRMWANNGHTPQEISSLFRHTGKPAAKKIGRNDLCPCGSGLKYKHCCGR